MSTVYVWSELRDRLVTLTGDAPSAPLEQRILDIFEHRPALVAEAVSHVSARFEAGVVRSAWPVLAKHVEQAAETATRAEVRVTERSGMTKAVELARHWVRNAGLYLSEEELLDDLFGDLGRLRAHAGDLALREELLDLWQKQQPRAAKAEREQEIRAAAWVGTRPKKRRRQERAVAGGAEGIVRRDRRSASEGREEGTLTASGSASVPERESLAGENGATGQEVGLTATARNPFLA